MRKFGLLLILSCVCFGQDAWETQTWIPSDAVQYSDLQLRDLVAKMCPVRPDGPDCAVCPDGHPGHWEIRSIVPGHFLSSSSNDVLVSGFGCESHADGVSWSVLFTWDRSSLRKVRYMAGMNAWDCKKLQGSDGRDRLVCGLADGNQGHLYSSLYVLDPGVERFDEWGNPSFSVGFFSVEDTTGSGETRMESATIERVEFADLAAAHHVRIVVTARLGQAVVPAGIVKRGIEGGPMPKVATVLRRYEFVFDGAKVLPNRHYPPAVAPVTSYSVPR